MLIKHLLDIPPLLAQFQGVMVTLLPQVALPGLTRVSLGIENTEGDINTLIHALETIARPSRAARGRRPESEPIGLQRQMDDFARAAVQRVYTPLR